MIEDEGPLRTETRLATRQVLEANERMKRLVRLERMLASPIERTPAGGSYVLGLPTDLQQEYGEEFAETLARVVDGAAPQGTKMRVGLFLFEASADGHPELVGRGVSHTREVYLGKDEAGPYCFMAGVQADRLPGQSDRMGNWVRATATNPDELAGALGSCAVYAKYGMPGPRMAEWMRNGGYLYASPSLTRWNSRKPDSSSRYVWNGRLQWPAAGTHVRSG